MRLARRKVGAFVRAFWGTLVVPTYLAGTAGLASIAAPVLAARGMEGPAIGRFLLAWLMISAGGVIAIMAIGFVVVDPLVMSWCNYRREVELFEREEAEAVRAAGQLSQAEDRTGALSELQDDR